MNTVGVNVTAEARADLAHSASRKEESFLGFGCRGLKLVVIQNEQDHDLTAENAVWEYFMEEIAELH